MFGGTFICTAASRPASSNLPLTSSKSFWIINSIEYLTKKKNLKKSKHQKIAWVPSYSKSDVNLQWRQCSNSDHFIVNLQSFPVFLVSKLSGVKFNLPPLQLKTEISRFEPMFDRMQKEKSNIEQNMLLPKPCHRLYIRQVSQKWICVQGLCKNVPKIQSQYKDYPIFRPHFLETSSRLIFFNCFELVPS